MSGCFKTVDNIRPPIDIFKQSEILKGPEQIHVSKFYKEAKNGKFVVSLSDDARTLYETFRKGVISSNNGHCLGWRETPNSPYQWMNYNETLLRAKNFGSGLIGLGLQPRSFIGVYSQNRPEWILLEQGAYCYSLIIVPLYDTLGIDACSFIITQTNMIVVLVEDDLKVNQILDKCPRTLRIIIAIKPLRPATLQRAKNRGLEIVTFADVERLGTSQNHPEVPPQPQDLCTVCYTSGTMGNPKGVMLTHSNVVASISAILLQLEIHKPRVGDVMMSFLPLAHMLERCCENAMYYAGAAVGFYSGEIKNLTNDVKALRPTVMPAVPRLLNRVYDKLQHDMAHSPIRRLLFNMALKSKKKDLQQGIYTKNSIWDKLVFKRVQDSFGGNLRLMIVGSAPLAGAVLTFARCALGCIICEGYGQTECTAPISLTIYGEINPDHVGPPVASNCVKLVDAPEMDYYCHQNQGEVCVKGANVFVGYYKDPERTMAAIDEDGWHHTGDIGMWLPNGTLKIIDRRKHIFKLSQGEYIVPEKIEAIYLRSQYIEQVFVYGESLKVSKYDDGDGNCNKMSCIVAVVVPNVDVIKSWALENNIPGTLTVLCNNVHVKELITTDMLAWGKEGGLKSFEQVKDVYLHPDLFSVQNQLLTPNMKLKRAELKNYFKPQLEDMYKSLT